MYWILHEHLRFRWLLNMLFISQTKDWKKWDKSVSIASFYICVLTIRTTTDKHWFIYNTQKSPKKSVTQCSTFITWFSTHALIFILFFLCCVLFKSESLSSKSFKSDAPHFSLIFFIICIQKPEDGLGRIRHPTDFSILLEKPTVFFFLLW